MAEHTKGPWKAKPFGDGDFRIVYGENGNWLAEVFDDGIGGEQCSADARLIAAAPQLYSACEAALEVCEHSHIRAILRAALSAATGSGE